LYHAPGVLLAYPGGAIGQRFGDKAAVLAGLGLMILGGLIMALVPGWSAQIAGRLIAGMGGILLNVLMSKMVTDWFAGKEIATAMGIFVNSWPVGIALGLLVHPLLAVYGGLTIALLGVVAFLAIAAMLLTVGYQAQNSPLGPGTVLQTSPTGLTLAAILLAGTIWGTYNAALAVVFGFGSLMLVERGWSLAAAASTTSLTLWLVAVSVPVGGFIADRVNRHITILLVGLALFATALILTPRMSSPYAGFVLLGLFGGLAAGPIMSLPSRVLQPATRAIGMGMFFTVFYLCHWLGPWLAGTLSSGRGTASASFDFGAGLLGVCAVLVCLFLGLARALAAKPLTAAAP
jgi:MFS family permease